MNKDYKGTWVENFLEDSDFTYEYIVSMMWTIQTITTVGYGDIDIENNYERIIGSVIMIGGVILFTVANASLMTILEAIDDSGEYNDLTESLI